MKKRGDYGQRAIDCDVMLREPSPRLRPKFVNLVSSCKWVTEMDKCMCVPHWYFLILISFSGFVCMLYLWNVLIHQLGCNFLSFPVIWLKELRMPSSARDEADVDTLREQVDTLTKKLQECEARSAEQKVKTKRRCGLLIVTLVTVVKETPR